MQDSVDSTVMSSLTQVKASFAFLCYITVVVGGGWGLLRICVSMVKDERKLGMNFLKLKAFVFKLINIENITAINTNSLN